MARIAFGAVAGRGVSMVDLDTIGPSLDGYASQSFNDTTISLSDGPGDALIVRGTGFRVGVGPDGPFVAGGTIASLALTVGGVRRLDATGLNVSAPRFFDLEEDGFDAALVALLTAGNDTVIGTTAADTLVGGAGNDVVAGGTGADVMLGDAGADRLIGGLGADVLLGGGGADTFVYADAAHSRGAAGDRIADFAVAGGDRIDLSALDADPGRAGNQAFAFRGTRLFTEAEGEVRVVQTTASTRTVLVDIDGVGAADLVILVSGSGPLSADDFIL